MSIANLSLSGYTAGPAYFSQVDSKDGSGRKMDLATFKIAHNPRSGRDKEKGIFVRVSAWGIQAQIARDRLTAPGVFVSVAGPITSCGTVYDKDNKLVVDKDGQPIVSLEITAQHLEIPRQAGEAAPASGYSQSSNTGARSSSPAMAHESSGEMEVGDEMPF